MLVHPDTGSKVLQPQFIYEAGTALFQSLTSVAARKRPPCSVAGLPGGSCICLLRGQHLAQTLQLSLELL